MGAGIAVFLAVLIGSFVAGRGGSNNSPASSPSSQRAGSQTPTSANPPPNAVPTQKSQPQTAEAAAEAARVYVNAIFQAPFLAEAEARARLEPVVLPAQLDSYIKSLPGLGRQWANLWGYPSIADAAQFSGAYDEAQNYKVLSHKGKEVKVAVYHVQMWQYPVATSQKSKVPDITWIRMRYVDGKWRYVSSSVPPKNQRPPNRVDLSIPTTIRSYKPYIKGWETYG